MSCLQGHLSSALVLDQIARSSHVNFLTVGDLVASLGLALYEGEDLEGFRFVNDVAACMPHLKTVLAALLEYVLLPKAGGAWVL